MYVSKQTCYVTCLNLKDGQVDEVTGSNVNMSDFVFYVLSMVSESMVYKVSVTCTFQNIFAT